MPNWCTQNVILTGKKEELQQLADIINDLPNRESVSENGFGKYWLWNFYEALGFPYKQFKEQFKEKFEGRCSIGRGIIDPNSDTMACLFCPEPECDNDEQGTEVFENKNGVFLAFSITRAWAWDDVTISLIAQKFSSIKYAAWKATDEFGNFHYYYDPNNLFDLPKYVFGFSFMGESTYIDAYNFDDFKKEIIESLAGADFLDELKNSKDFKELADILMENANENLEIFEIYEWIQDLE